jgi:hypothetical protein
MEVQLSDNVSSGFSAAAASIGLTLPQTASVSPSVGAPGAPLDFPEVAAAPLQSRAPASRDAARPTIDSQLGTAAAAFLHAPRPLSVEFHTDSHPNEIVTILRDPSTGEVYAEFPADAVVRLAEFFQHLAGFVVDQKA